VLAVWQRRRLTLFEGFALALTFWVGLDAIRGVTWFVLTVLVIAPHLLDGALRVKDAGHTVALEISQNIAVVVGALGQLRMTGLWTSRNISTRFSAHGLAARPRGARATTWSMLGSASTKRMASP
jgi:hypothetical protein